MVTQPRLIRDQNKGRQTSRSVAIIEMSWKSTSAIVNSKSQLLPGKEGSQSAVKAAGPQAYPQIRPALSSKRSRRSWHTTICKEAVSRSASKKAWRLIRSSSRRLPCNRLLHQGVSRYQHLIEEAIGLGLLLQVQKAVRGSLLVFLHIRQVGVPERRRLESSKCTKTSS